MKHVNIPIFIPHMGCPNMCVFCNQRTISGASCFSEDKVDDIVRQILASVHGVKPEIAFFGGSFTGIDRKLMIRLLDKAERYVRDGKVSGVRMSTRPDYIDREIIEILKSYSISQVELGIQSMSDEVLSKCKRGHSASETVMACEMLSSAGFEIVGQMMIGLPGSDIDCEIETAKKICDLKCAAARIYPTIVFRDTELYSMYVSGKYKPLTTEEAVERSAAALEVFDSRGVDCIRIGLCESENLHGSETYAAGPNDSGLGEMVISRIFYNKISAYLDSLGEHGLSGKTLTVFCSSGSVSKTVGHKKKNKQRICEKYGIKKFKVVEKKELIGYNIQVMLSDGSKINKEDGICI